MVSGAAVEPLSGNRSGERARAAAARRRDRAAGGRSGAGLGAARPAAPKHRRDDRPGDGDAARRAQTIDPATNPALTTRLGYILTGDSRVDQISEAGLTGLSEYVNRRTAAALVRPDAVEPGRTDLSLYPLLYWPITADVAAPSAEQVTALNDYMAHAGSS